MGRLKTVLIISFLTIVFTLVGLFLIGYFSPKGAGLLVKSNIQSSVYLDNEFVGTTPLEKTFEAKEFLLKVAPSDQSAKPFETKIKLTPGVQTTVTKDFEKEEDMSRGEVLSFEKITGREAKLSVISIPDRAQVGIGGRILGFTPFNTSLAEGEHEIELSLPGYTSRKFTIRTYSGHLLTAFVQLGREFVPEVKSEQVSIKMVEVLETPNNFLRVRREPSAESEEIARVEPLERFELLGEENGWYKIESTEGVGWVSSDYTQITEENN